MDLKALSITTTQPGSPSSQKPPTPAAPNVLSMIMGHDVGLCFLRQDGEAARLRNGNNETSRHTTRPLLVPQQGQETCATTPPQPQTIKQQADEVRIILFNDVCAICSDDIKYGERCRALPNCSHMYHQQCLAEWLKINEDCPLCRTYTVFKSASCRLYHGAAAPNWSKKVADYIVKLFAIDLDCKKPFILLPLVFLCLRIAHEWGDYEETIRLYGNNEARHHAKQPLLAPSERQAPRPQTIEQRDDEVCIALLFYDECDIISADVKHGEPGSSQLQSHVSPAMPHKVVEDDNSMFVSEVYGHRNASGKFSRHNASGRLSK
ncbi:hypothetical protein RJ640_030801 [Escallonia rubra]|uniref:RING-type domain-containing protein n=1 Tax=Escallonia rubra TaxID=112253 RepID=A0AA88RXY3_9ASTE|nr:hypothetical protein RJ640_030801 [Escallonia rubra]